MPKPLQHLNWRTPIALCWLSLAAVSSAQAGFLTDHWLKRQQARSQDASPSASSPAAPWRALPNQAYGNDPQQRFDVYVPNQRGAPLAPVVFMVHGGAWVIGDKGHRSVWQNKVAHWLAQGVCVVSVNYRLAPLANPLEQAQDVARALATAQQQAASWGGDRQRFVLMGHSAGAHLVALLASQPRTATELGAAPWLGSVLLDSAALDVVKVMNTPKHHGFYDKAFGRNPALWEAASPLHVLSASVAPMLAVCSTQRSEACPQTQAFADKATALGSTVQIVPMDLSHGDINEQLGLPGAYTDTVDAFLRALPGWLTPPAR